MTVPPCVLLNSEIRDQVRENVCIFILIVFFFSNYLYSCSSDMTFVARCHFCANFAYFEAMGHFFGPVLDMCVLWPFYKIYI